MSEERERPLGLLVGIKGASSACLSQVVFVNWPLLPLDKLLLFL
jgi:hypothetical protein